MAERRSRAALDAWLAQAHRLIQEQEPHEPADEREEEEKFAPGDAA
ncbi:MAG TPA: hypothetical protein VMR97_06340 [Acidimicrobiales bacterium]|nr:hypothetical protein [Acidimicrobiales bacterium]